MATPCVHCPFRTQQAMEIALSPPRMEAPCSESHRVVQRSGGAGEARTRDLEFCHTVARAHNTGAQKQHLHGVRDSTPWGSGGFEVLPFSAQCTLLACLLRRLVGWEQLHGRRAEDEMEGLSPTCGDGAAGKLRVRQ